MKYMYPLSDIYLNGIYLKYTYMYLYICLSRYISFTSKYRQNLIKIKSLTFEGYSRLALIEYKRKYFFSQRWRNEKSLQGVIDRSISMSKE